MKDQVEIEVYMKYSAIVNTDTFTSVMHIGILLPFYFSFLIYNILHFQGTVKIVVGIKYD